MAYRTIDIELALDQLGGSDKLYKTVVMGFYKRYREVNLTIENHMKDGEQEAARRLTHSIKGLCGNLGALKLKDKSKDLEMAIKSNASNQQGYLCAFAEELANVVEDVAMILKTRYGGDDVEALLHVTGSNPFVSACHSLETALGTYRYSDVKVAKENLSNVQIPKHLQEDISVVMHLIESFEYDMAVERLGKVCG